MSITTKKSRLVPGRTRLFALAAVAALLATPQTQAGPLAMPGDMALRHDIQRLADYGLIKGAVTTWPLAWAPIAADLAAVDTLETLPPDVRHAVTRVRARLAREHRAGEARFNAHASAAEEPTRIRSFQDTPRESAELGAGIEYTGERFVVALNAQAVDSPSDGKDFRADGSMLGVNLGNYAVTANTLDRWWGPGWDGSLILSNNARPIPALSIDRNSTRAFETKWLSWLGPWDLSVHFGQMESDRVIPDARFFGMRFNFRPIPSLEIGLSRTAQWCGEGRPCGFDTFTDLFFGRDNRGDEGVDIANEPGNQLAGIDLRWAAHLFSMPVAFYGQFIGEDEAGGFPSRYLGQLGLETTGLLGGRWSYRAFGEFAGTSCQFHESSELFNCAYNHGIYQTGYRYRGRSVGHGADNDARVISAGLMLVNEDDAQWQVLARYGGLNRGGAPDERNSLTPTRQDIASLDLTHSRLTPIGRIELGLGYEQVDDLASGENEGDARLYLAWRSR